MPPTPSYLSPGYPPHYCKGCATCVDGIPGATRLHPTINFWLCDGCWRGMTPHQRADLRLRLMELEQKQAEIEKMDDIAALMRDVGERRLRLEEEVRDEDGWWRRGGRGGRDGESPDVTDGEDET